MTFAERAQQRSSESRLLISDRLPMRVGTSPFRVKGHVYEKMRADFAETAPGGLEGLLARIADDEITAFATQPFMASSWYDALPMMPLSIAHAHALGVPFHHHLRDRGRYVAERDIPGIYRVLLRLSSPELVASRLPRASMQYFNFGQSEATTLRPGLVRIWQAGVPVTLVPLIAATHEGFVSAAMEMAGARRVVVRCVDTLHDGERGGVSTLRVELEIAWE
jgi:hypothetical protein